jgi:hypothetical protein
MKRWVIESKMPKIVCTWCADLMVNDGKWCTYRHHLPKSLVNISCFSDVRK